MLAAGIGPGDEVIVPTLTFAATANAVIHTGATPVFADVVPHAHVVSPEQAESLLGSSTRAIVPVHFAGYPCAMGRLERLASDHGLLLIDDAAHCIEGWAQGRKVGTIGDATCFSFYVTKNVTTIEGGMVTSPHPDLVAKVKTLALHGLSSDAWRRFADAGFAHYQVVAAGFKCNMTDVEAAIGLHQLSDLPASSLRRASVWSRYDDAFRDLPVELPALPVIDGDIHARHLYILQLDLDRLTVNRDRVVAALHAENIGAGIHYMALHLQPYYRDRFALDPADFPVATAHSARCVSLPLAASLSDNDVDDVVAGVRRVLLNYRR
jgi:dTDP-4-amino-4,6-dideoxygalactose transaminase